MKEGSKLKITPEAWERYRLANNVIDPCPKEVTVEHVAGELTSLNGYVYLGWGLFWWRVEDLV